MINKIWRYFIAKILLATGNYKEGVGFTLFERDAEILFGIIVENKKKRDTKNCPVELKEGCNG